MCNNAQVKKSRLNIGVIGAGWIANLSHGPALRDYARENPHICLKAVCDVNPDLSAQFSKRFGFEVPYSNSSVMLEKERLDAVYVLVPCRAMASLAESTLRLGIPTFIEKPPGRNPQEVRKLIQIARESKTANFVAFNRRFMPLLRIAQKRLLSIVDEEGLAPETISYSLLRHGRFDADFSTTAIHPIDAVSFLCQSPYQAVQFDYHKMGLSNRHDNISLYGRLVSGTHISIEINPDAGVNDERLMVHFPGRTLILALPCVKGMGDGFGCFEEYKGGVKISAISGSALPESLNDGFHLETQMFLDGLGEGKREFTGYDLTSSLQSVEIMNAIENRKSAYRVETLATDGAQLYAETLG